MPSIGFQVSLQVQSGNVIDGKEPDMRNVCTNDFLICVIDSKCSLLIRPDKNYMFDCQEANRTSHNRCYAAQHDSCQSVSCHMVRPRRRASGAADHSPLLPVLVMACSPMEAISTFSPRSAHPQIRTLEARCSDMLKEWTGQFNWVATHYLDF